MQAASENAATDDFIKRLDQSFEAGTTHLQKKNASIKQQLKQDLSAHSGLRNYFTVRSATLAPDQRANMY